MNRRPEITSIAPAASPQEAAAVVGALEQFIRATAPEPAGAGFAAGPPVSPWLTAALAEGVARWTGNIKAGIPVSFSYIPNPDSARGPWNRQR